MHQDINVLSSPVGFVMSERMMMAEATSGLHDVTAAHQAVINDTGLSFTAKGLYAYLYAQANPVTYEIVHQPHFTQARVAPF